MPRIVHICNTLQKTENICLGTESSLLSLAMVIYARDTTRTRSPTVQNDRLPTEPHAVKNRLFSFFFPSYFSEANSILTQLLAFVYT